MRRSPFYAYPNFPHGFYSPPAEAPYHRPPRPFPPSSPATPPTPTPRSVINIPVVNSAPELRPIDSQPPSPPALYFPAVPLIDPSSAATTIQSCFRGFCVRRHHPLLHLRSIANARKQLEELQSDFESPEFLLKMRASEKERLRFSETVMAIIFRLDAIEGSMADVRSQRREATKIAIKLQDALDALMMQKDEIADLKPTHGPFPEDGVVPDDDVALRDQSEGPLCPNVNTVQGGGLTISEEGIMDVNLMQKEYASPADVMDNCTPNLNKHHVMDMVDENGSPLHPVTDAEAIYEAEHGMSNVIGENAGSDATHAAEEEVNDASNALHLEPHKNHMHDDALVAMVDQDTSVIVASHGSAKVESSGGSYTCMNVVQEAKESLSQDVESCPGSPTAEEKCDYPHDSNGAHQNQLQGPTTGLERLTDGNCSSYGKGSPTFHRHGYEQHSDESRENRSDEASLCNEGKAQSSPLSMVGTPPLPDSALLHELSEDCRQLKSLVGKLLVQNKAQSKVLCALGERLELLEHQHKLECQRNRQNMRVKKLKKGSKRSRKYHNCE